MSYRVDKIISELYTQSRDTLLSHTFYFIGRSKNNAFRKVGLGRGVRRGYLHSTAPPTSLLALVFPGSFLSTVNISNMRPSSATEPHIFRFKKSPQYPAHPCDCTNGMTQMCSWFSSKGLPSSRGTPRSAECPTAGSSASRGNRVAPAHDAVINAIRDGSPCGIIAHVNGALLPRRALLPWLARSGLLFLLEVIYSLLRIGKGL